MGRQAKFTLEELRQAEHEHPKWDDSQLAKFFNVSPTAIYKKRYIKRGKQFQANQRNQTEKT
jgi:hypothetical protein